MPPAIALYTLEIRSLALPAEQALEMARSAAAKGHRVKMARVGLPHPSVTAFRDALDRVSVSARLCRDFAW